MSRNVNGRLYWLHCFRSNCWKSWRVLLDLNLQSNPKYICRCCLVDYLNRTPIFEWCGVRWTVWMEPWEDTWNHRTKLNSQKNWSHLDTQSEKQHKCTFDNRKGRSDFQSNLWRSFIKDLLMQHKFRCVNLIGRSWKTWKNNLLTSTYLTCSWSMTLISLVYNKRVRDSIIMLVVAKTCGYRGHPYIAFHGKDHNNHHSNLSSHIWLILISLSCYERERERESWQK